jgi:hypothetical protein
LQQSDVPLHAPFSAMHELQVPLEQDSLQQSAYA